MFDESVKHALPWLQGSCLRLYAVMFNPTELFRSLPHTTTEELNRSLAFLLFCSIVTLIFLSPLLRLTAVDYFNVSFILADTAITYAAFVAYALVFHGVSMAMGIRGPLVTSIVVILNMAAFQPTLAVIQFLINARMADLGTTISPAGAIHLPLDEWLKGKMPEDHGLTVLVAAYVFASAWVVVALAKITTVVHHVRFGRALVVCVVSAASFSFVDRPLLLATRLLWRAFRSQSAA